MHIFIYVAFFLPGDGMSEVPERPGDSDNSKPWRFFWTRFPKAEVFSHQPQHFVESIRTNKKKVEESDNANPSICANTLDKQERVFSSTIA